MRIGYICLDRGIPLFGHKGASNHVREFIGGLGKLGHPVEVFCARMGGSAADAPFVVRRVKASKGQAELPAGLASEAAALGQNAKLRELLEKAHRHEPFDLIYERYSLWSFAGLEFAEARGLPFVLEVNSPLLVEQKRYRSLSLEPAARAVEQLLFRSATLVAGVSRQVAAYVRSSSGRVQPTVVIPNGVDLDLFSSVPAAPAGDYFTLGFVGSLKPWHGLETLMEAFKTLAGESPDYRLLIAGDGPQRPWLERYMREHALTSVVELTGAVEKGRIPCLLGRMGVAVAPYPKLDDFYFSPLKLFEYMAAGRAIVASSIGQVAEILQHGRNGLLVRPADTKELAESIRLLRSNTELRRKLGQTAQREAFAKHGWERRVETFLNCVSDVSTAAALPPKRPLQAVSTDEI